MLGSVGVYETLLKAERTDLWKNRRKHKSKASAPWCKRGIGVTTAVKGFGFGALPDFGAASIEITPTGKFAVELVPRRLVRERSQPTPKLLQMRCTATSLTYTLPLVTHNSHPILELHPRRWPWSEAETPSWLPRLR